MSKKFQNLTSDSLFHVFPAFSKQKKNLFLYIEKTILEAISYVSK